MVVEPAKKDLLRGKAKELLESLILVKKAVELGVQLDIDLTEKTTTDDLPDKAKDQVLADLDDVASTNVNDGAADTLGGLDNDVVVLAHLESIEVLCLLSGHVHDSLVDGVGHAVVDELGKDETVLALVEHLESVSGEGQPRANVRVTGEDSIDVTSELGPLVLVDGVCDIGVGALNLDLAAHAAL